MYIRLLYVCGSLRVLQALSFVCDMIPRFLFHFLRKGQDTVPERQNSADAGRSIHRLYLKVRAFINYSLMKSQLTVDSEFSENPILNK